MDYTDPESSINIVEYSLNYLYSGDSKLKNYVSIIVSFLGFPFIFPLVALIGYLSKVRSSIINDEPVPTFEDYEELLYIGKNTIIVYIPVIFSIVFLILIGQYLPILLPMSIVPLILWPIVSYNFCEHLRIEKVYNGEILDVVLSKKFIKYYVIYIVFMTYIFTSMIIVGAITLGLAFVLLLPILIAFKTCFWSYAIKNVKEDIKESKTEE